MLINVGERQRINVTGLQRTSFPCGKGCHQKRSDEKILERADGNSQGRWPTMKRCKRVDLHERSSNSMFIDVRLLKTFATIIGFGLSFVFGACDRMITPRSAQVIKDAEAKSADGNYVRAITLYESALDGSAKSADIHYRLALLYDDKLHDPLNALHHFKRYLTLAPTGPHATEVKNFLKKDELELGTSLSGDSVVTRAEAARLKNENLALRKELEDQRARLHNSPNEKMPSGSAPDGKNEGASKTSAGKSRTYVVHDGDTLASISRKFYKSSGHWRKIREANRDIIDNPAKLKAGQTLTIP
jgi:LysM repeat protein